MANADWQKGKCHGGTEAKAVLLHHDKEQRLIHEHLNDKINKDLTPYNYSYYGLSYTEKCNKYDIGVAKASEGVRMSSGKNANVTMQVIVMYPPDALSGDEQRKWYMRVGDMAQERWGDMFIDMDVHVDEVHEYEDSDTGELVMSKVHGNLCVVPINRKGKLNGMYFSGRGRIIKWNDEVERMTQQEFGCKWNSGKKKKRRAMTVEELKARSEQRAVERGADKIIENAKAEEKSARDAKKRQGEHFGKMRNEMLQATERARQKEISFDNRKAELERSYKTAYKALYADFETKYNKHKEELETGLKNDYNARREELEKEYQQKQFEYQTLLQQLQKGIKAYNKLIELGKQKEIELEQQQSNVRGDRMKQLQRKWGSELEKWERMQQQQNDNTGLQF